jgi:hypothetical protein
MRILALAAAIATLACASAARTGANASRVQLLAADIAATDALNAFDAVERLRPQWLRSRGPTSIENATPTYAHVFMDGRNAGDLEFLKSLHTRDVVEMRFLTAGEAAVRYGMGHLGGVIEVTTVRRRGDPPAPVPQ